ncbi:unnamed protein product [Owenia fusiformis]|uniref:Uncharacterized protein n=1 Tax=Owenia fusiformis TaxID=6347 RepID=A0A8J1TDE6_OWEFU|nr:unnamed protein product [Owenia fusiformis]
MLRNIGIRIRTNICNRCLKNIGIERLYHNPGSYSSQELTNQKHKKSLFHLRLSTNNQRLISFWGASTANDWSKAISDAEKIVGYPTSFMSLRCLLSDELSNIAVQMRKLVGTKHPLLKTARGFVYDGKHTMQTRGLVVLLISKAAVGTEVPSEQELIAGIHPKQRQLAEISEMIYTANLIHKGVIDVSDMSAEDGCQKDLEFGNKMAVLSGDFLLASASMGLAELHNTKVVEIVSGAIGDLMRAEFTELCSPRGTPSLTSSTTYQDWETQTFLSSGSLLAKCCQSTLELAGHCKEMQDKAFQYGKHLAFAHQLHEDLQPFTHPTDENGDQISLGSAPVILHYSKPENKPHLNRLLDSHVDQKKLRDTILSGTAVEETKRHCKENGKIAINAIESFPSSEAKTALENMINAVTNNSR